VLLEDVEGPYDAARVAERIMDELRRPFAIEDQTLFATASIGIALGNARTSTPEDLLRNADTAMYRAKEDKAGYQQYDPTMHDQVVRRLKLQNDLRRAAEAGEFVVHYQPHRRPENRRCVGH
jgi:predicted signal transduction protein with EAL and GGDEF domain